jgi:peptidoglycan/LPS O-acetylase OafA/YrhL
MPYINRVSSRKFFIFSLIYVFVMNINAKLLHDTPFPEFYSNPLVILSEFCIGISFYKLMQHSKNWFYSNRIMIYLCEISYSFCIWQFFAMWIGKYLLMLDFGIWSVTMLVFTTNIAMSILSFNLIEEKMRKLIIKKMIKH